MEFLRLVIEYAKRYKNEWISLVLCQNTFVNCISSFEPVKPLYAKPRPMTNIINFIYLEYFEYIIKLSARKIRTTTHTNHKGCIIYNAYKPIQPLSLYIHIFICINVIYGLMVYAHMCI